MLFALVAAQFSIFLLGLFHHIHDRVSLSSAITLKSFSFIVPAFVVPLCFNERVPCSRPGMARSTRRSKPDQRGAETLGGLPARLHAIRKVGFDQLV